MGHLKSRHISARSSPIIPILSPSASPRQDLSIKPAYSQVLWLVPSGKVFTTTTCRLRHIKRSPYLPHFSPNRSGSFTIVFYSARPLYRPGIQPGSVVGSSQKSFHHPHLPLSGQHSLAHISLNRPLIHSILLGVHSAHSTLPIHTHIVFFGRNLHRPSSSPWLMNTTCPRSSC